MHTSNAAFPDHCPDGLTVEAIDTLIAEVAAELATGSPATPTTSMWSGSAWQRRDRRETRRSMAAVVRSLPIWPIPTVAPDGEAA
jgi:O-methyltransferase involved in polyketide biosynthesis